jgi:hypothetical protein
VDDPRWKAAQDRISAIAPTLSKPPGYGSSARDGEAGVFSRASRRPETTSRSTDAHQGAEDQDVLVVKLA